MKNILKLVVFSVRDERLHVLFEEEALIMQAISVSEDLDAFSKRVFFSVTRLSPETNYIEQLYTFFEKKEKDIVVVYYVLIPESVSSFPKHLHWEEVSNITKRHQDSSIIHYAIQRLRWKIEYTNVVYSFLADTFTLSELQKVYEIILGQKLDKRNFRKKILSLDFLKATNQKRIGNSRPAQMYSFKKREPQIIKIFS